MLFLLILHLAVAKYIEDALGHYGMEISSSCRGFKELEKDIKKNILSNYTISYNTLINNTQYLGQELSKIEASTLECFGKNNIPIFNDFAQSLQLESECIVYYCFFKYLNEDDTKFYLTIQEDPQFNELQLNYQRFSNFSIQENNKCSKRSYDIANALYLSLSNFSITQPEKRIFPAAIDSYAIKENQSGVNFCLQLGISVATCNTIIKVLDCVLNSIGLYQITNLLVFHCIEYFQKHYINIFKMFYSGKLGKDILKPYLNDLYNYLKANLNVALFSCSLYSLDDIFELLKRFYSS